MQGIIPCLVDNCRKNEYNGAVNGIRLRIGTARRGGCCFVHVLKEAVDPRKETIPMADEKNRTVLTKEGLKKLEEQLADPAGGRVLWNLFWSLRCIQEDSKPCENCPAFKRVKYDPAISEAQSLKKIFF